MKAVKIVTICAAALIAACLIGLLVAGSLWGIPPFGGLYDVRMAKLKGNGKQYDLEGVTPKDSVLTGKRIIFLGSSVTYGAASQGVSFADYLCRRNGCTMVKEAVSGTTLCDGKDSYVRRIMQIGQDQADILVCQLSTNDATQNKPLGVPVGRGDYDLDTVCGAVEFIRNYAADRWHCPVVFFTNSRYDSRSYAQMVEALKQIASLYPETGVINLFDDGQFNDISEELRSLYMADDVHPTKAGYLLWWTPAMEKYLCNFVEERL